MGEPFKLGLRGSSTSRSAFGDQFQLRLDPEISEELDKLRWRLEFDRIQGQLYQPDWSGIDWLLKTAMTTPPSPAPAPNPFSPGLSPPPLPASKMCAPSNSSSVPEPPNAPLRKGEASDILKAVTRLPAVEAMLSDVSCQLDSQWNRMGTGGKAILITQSVIIGGGAIAGIAANEPSRVWVLQKLSGVSIPVPKVDGLSFSLYSPNGVIAGGGLQYKNSLLEAKGGFEQLTLPDNTRFNNLSVSVTLNVSEAIPLITKWLQK